MYIPGSSSNLQQIYEEESDPCVSILCLPDYDGVDVICMENGESGEDLSGEGTNVTEFLQLQVHMRHFADNLLFISY